VAWAQAVVDRLDPAVRVSAVAMSSVDVGTTTRVRLDVVHDSDARLPRRWFVKLPSSSWRARTVTGLVRLPQQEVRFYRHLAPAMGDACPTALAATAQAGRGFTLVLPDLTDMGATTLRASDHVSVDDVARVVETLAAVHAHGSRIARGPRWLNGLSRRLENRCGTVLSVPLVRRGLRKADNAVPERLHARFGAYARRRGAVMTELATSGPTTVVHHDCHPGNLFWHDGKAGLLDWQLVRQGDGIGDVAYLLATSLAPDARAGNERALLDLYVDALAAHGAPIGADPVRRYRQHLAYPLEAMLVTLAVGGFMPDSEARELVRRAATAVDHNESLEALDSLRR
jgi:thiamine kinase-like enzyme